MKNLLRAVNVILAVIIIFVFFAMIRGKSSRQPARPVKNIPKSGKITKKISKSSKLEQSKKPKQMAKMTASEEIEFLLKNNIFDVTRSPLAGTTQGRTEMTLVGTFTVGDRKGAIILQKTTQRRNNFMPMIQGQMQQGGRRSGFRSGDSGQQRAANGRGGQRSANTPQVFAQNTPNTTAAQSAEVKQFVKLGDTLTNGYTLTEVTKTSATLIKGGERAELQLAEASKNIPARSGGNRTLNGRQQFQQFLQTMQSMQRQQGFQNMQMMRMLQNQNNNGGSANGRRTGRR